MPPVVDGAFTPAVRAAILEVTNGRCARCGVPAVQAHHRAPRKAGGTHNPDIGAPFNGLPLCGPCHTHIEANRDEARRNGWLLTHPCPAAPFWTTQWGWRAWVLIDGCWLHEAAAPPTTEQETSCGPQDT